MPQTAARHPHLSLSLTITLALAAVCLYLAFRGIRWEEMVETMRRGRAEQLLVASLLLSVSYLLRALRWRVLLSAERVIHPVTMFWGTSIGYLGNSFLPARAGELLRSVLIGQRAALSKSYVLATALTERIADALFLTLIALWALASVSNMPEWLLSAVRAMAVLGIGGFVTLLIAPRFERVITKLLHRLPEGISAKVIGIAEQFLSGMQALQRVDRATMFALFTVIVWAMDVLFAVQIAASFDMVLTVPQALLLLAALGLASAAPSTPGYVGIYQFVAIPVLVPFGYTQSSALVYILAFQAVSYAVVLVWGLLGLWRLGLPNEVPLRSDSALMTGNPRD